jgi:hypothetical protein
VRVYYKEGLLKTRTRGEEKIEEEKMSKFCKKGVAPNFFLIHRGQLFQNTNQKQPLKLSDTPIVLQMLQTEQHRLI